jgi:hypothetical protein
MSADDVVVLFCLGRAATSELRQESRKAVQIKVKAFFITGNYSKAKSGCSGSHSFLLVGEAGVHLHKIRCFLVLELFALARLR